MPDTYHVLVTDIAWPSTAPEEKILAQAGAELILAPTGAEVDLLRLAPQADAILTNWAQVPASVIAAASRLQIISRYGIGVDNIDVAEATKRGVIVTNVPTYCLEEVTEHALALLLALARKVCYWNNYVHANEWEITPGKPIFRVSGKTLGIVGLGKIGQTLVPKARALGLHVLAYDPFVPAERVAALGCDKAELDDLLRRSDFVSIHAPLMDSTRGLLNRERLRLMKPGAYLINVARGAIVDLLALAEALRGHWIAGAGIDVFDPERLPAGHPLLSAPNLVATPHVAFYSEESLADLQVQAAENVAAVLSGKRPGPVINRQVLSLPRWAHLR
jgi:D-3-phosphoglycerate dehydrogenase / 2-oxoglutarate reductase